MLHWDQEPWWWDKPKAQNHS